MLQKKEIPLNIMEFYDWYALQYSKNPDESHGYVTLQELNFMQQIIYPMFYNDCSQFTSCEPFPLVLQDYSSISPKYVIDNSFFTIIFFSYNTYYYEVCWEVSVHIKDILFCAEKIEEFSTWYRRHYAQRIFVELEDMPAEFKYSKLDPLGGPAKDFCIEFWNDTRDFMLFKLMDLFRLF